MAHQASPHMHDIHHTQTTAREPIQISELLATHAHWALRFSLASVFIYHGAMKFMDIAMFAEMMQFPLYVAVFVATAETVGGTLVLAGSFIRDWVTRIGAAMIIPVMLGAITMVHWGQWNFMVSETHPMGGMEFQVTLLLVATYFVLRGNRE